MEYTPSQKDAIRAYIAKKGFTVNEKGCEVWNSAELDRTPYYRLPLESGKGHSVNLRTFIWMEGNGGTRVKDTHTSCGTFTCIKLDHILPDRRPRGTSNTSYVFTESESSAFTEKICNGVTPNESGCHIWGGTLIHGKIPCLAYGHIRNICISRFLWTRNNVDFNPHTHRLNLTCGEDKCINIAHFQLVDKKKEFDPDHAWKLLLKKTTRVDDCLVVKNPGPEGYGSTNLGGVVMASHRASFILNKNGGRPIPSVDEHGNRLVIRHLCHDQPGCISPEHLELGTQITNAFEDKVATGTLLRGGKNPRSKITEDVAQKIKNSLRDVGDPEYVIKKIRAETYGATMKIVASIDENRTWAHLPNRFGVVKSNEEHRVRARKRKRVARTESWSDQDFENAGTMIRENVTETEEGKGGSFPPGECWIWNLGKNFRKYGITSFKNRDTRAHILSLESKHKRFEKLGEVVRHLCASPSCCNPEHLRFGSRKENAIDVLLHRSSNSAKMNPAKVRLIRASTSSNKELSRVYGIGRGAINNIRKRKTWSFVV